MPSAFLFDPNRCTGCQACELACSIENDLGAELSWREVITFNDASIPGIPRFHLSLACNHCAEPACMYSCPALAYTRDVSTGAILIDPGRCIGCRYCSWACPFGAPRYEADRGVMGKCTFCSHRLAEGLKPACATLCPTGALDFAVLDASELGGPVVGFPRTDLGPSIRIEVPRRAAHLAGAGASVADTSAAPRPVPGVTLRSEWSLAAFTFLVAVLVAGFVGTLGGGPRPLAALFATVAVVAAGLSFSHLGKPARAWRAGLNVRRSWLSREVVGFGAFASGATAVLALGPSTPATAAAAVAVAGLATLVSADMVYRPVYPGRHPLLDDGGALLTGVYLAGLWAGSPWLAGAAGLLKAVAVLRPASRSDSKHANLARNLAIPRLLLGLALPAVAWTASGAPLPEWVLLGAIGGEALGRIRFYLQLRVQSPARQVRIDLAGALASTLARPSA